MRDVAILIKLTAELCGANEALVTVLGCCIVHAKVPSKETLLIISE